MVAEKSYNGQIIIKMYMLMQRHGAGFKGNVFIKLEFMKNMVNLI